MSSLIPLANWLVDVPERAVACGQYGTVLSSALKQRVVDWYHAIPAHAGERWAVYHKDTLEFAAIVFALWQKGATACITGDNLPATVARLEKKVNGFVGDFSFTNTTLVAAAVPVLSGVDHPHWSRLTQDFQALEIYTSGSTGTPKPIAKTISDIDLELASLEQWWPQGSDAVIVSTVTHQHLYGLTFRLFWPLSRGQVFECETFSYTEDMLSCAAKHEKYVFVSTPSHLSRMNTALDWTSVAPACHAIVSSAAPLKAEDSYLVAQLLNAPVKEIYGSSETGAIAWRIQQPEELPYWQLLPQLTLAPSEAEPYVVNGPYIPNGYLLADQISLAEDSRFLLQGRLDRIVKVEGKRLSLNEAEQTTEQHDYVKNAKALVITRRRAEVALVIELTDAGERVRAQLGKRALQKELRGYLQDYFETVLLPRRWRFVEAMPYNAQGKLPVERLKAMFEPEPVKQPNVLESKVEESSVQLLLGIPAKLVYFDGHFDNNPILPGVVQVHWAEQFGRSLLSVVGTFQRLEVVKFQQVIFPDSQVSLNLEYNAEKQKLSFRYFSNKGVHSSGRICFN